MNRYLVPVTRNCTETTHVDVEASSVEEAMEKALVEASRKPWDFDWVYDDGSGGGDEPYIADDSGEGVQVL